MPVFSCSFGAERQSGNTRCVGDESLLWFVSNISTLSYSNTMNLW